MNKPVLWSMVIIAVASVAGRWLGPILGINTGLVTLGLIVAASALLSALIAIKRRELRMRLAKLPRPEQEVVRRSNPELRFAEGAGTVSGPSARTATWLGVIWINTPIIPWIVAPLTLRQYLAGQQHADWIGALFVLLGFVCAWAWWSINVTLWRRWAARQGIDATELQWRGENASILWPKGHFLERTEVGRILEHFGRPAGSA